LRELLLSSPEKLLSDIMTTELKTITPESDQKQVAEIISKYNLVALPVIDEERRILGIVTIDDVIDILIT